MCKNTPVLQSPMPPAPRRARAGCAPLRLSARAARALSSEIKKNSHDISCLFNVPYKKVSKLNFTSEHFDLRICASTGAARVNFSKILKSVLTVREGYPADFLEFSENFCGHFTCASASTGAAAAWLRTTLGAPAGLFRAKPNPDIVTAAPHTSPGTAGILVERERER